MPSHLLPAASLARARATRGHTPTGGPLRPSPGALQPNRSAARLRDTDQIVFDLFSLCTVEPLAANNSAAALARHSRRSEGVNSKVRASVCTVPDTSRVTRVGDTCLRWRVAADDALSSRPYLASLESGSSAAGEGIASLAEGTAGSSPCSSRRRAVSRRPVAGTCLVAAASPKSGMLP